MIEPEVCLPISFGPGVGSTCQNKALGAECWAYCLAGWVGDPQRYTCRVNTSEQDVGIEAVDQPIQCELESVRRLPAVASPCDSASLQDAGLFGQSIEHSCHALGEGEVCIAHCSFGWVMDMGPTVFKCSNGSLVGVVGHATSLVCTPSVCNFSVPNAIGVSHDCRGTFVGNNCSASCETGFHGMTTTLQCLPTGNIVGESPTCSRAECHSLTLNAAFVTDCHGKRSKPQTCQESCLPAMPRLLRFGEACTVYCAEGYDAPNGGLEDTETTSVEL